MALMALELDPRFDLSKAYWLVAGIDPRDASIGSAAWSAYLVDGDLGHEIDVREIPEDWPFGDFARRTQFPFDPNKPEQTNGEVYLINTGLRDWAFDLTKDLKLPGLAETRVAYTQHPNARKPPFVLKGGHIAALTFWHAATGCQRGGKLAARKRRICRYGSSLGVTLSGGFGGD